MSRAIDWQSEPRRLVRVPTSALSKKPMSRLRILRKRVDLIGGAAGGSLWELCEELPWRQLWRCQRRRRGGGAGGQRREGHDRTEQGSMRGLEQRRGREEGQGGWGGGGGGVEERKGKPGGERRGRTSGGDEGEVWGGEVERRGSEVGQGRGGGEDGRGVEERKGKPREKRRGYGWPWRTSGGGAG